MRILIEIRKLHLAGGLPIFGCFLCIGQRHIVFSSLQNLARKLIADVCFVLECFALEKGLFVVLICHFFAEKLKSTEQIVLTRNLTALKCHFLTFLCQQTWLSDNDNLADFVFELTHQRLWTVASSLDQRGKGSNSIKCNSELRLICAKLAKRKLPLLNATFRKVP